MHRLVGRADRRAQHVDRVREARLARKKRRPAPSASPRSSGGSSRPDGLAGVGAEDAEAARRSSAARPAGPAAAAARESSTATSESSSSESAWITPACRKTASTAVIEPASAAVCEPAARWPAAGAAALHRQDRLLARDPPRDPARTSADCRTTRGRAGSGRSRGRPPRTRAGRSTRRRPCCRSRRTTERPSPRAAAGSRSARPSAPLCDEKPMFPAGKVCGAKVAFSPGPADEDAEAVRADQPRAVGAHPREQLVLPALALDPRLGEAGRDHAERLRAPLERRPRPRRGPRRRARRRRRGRPGRGCRRPRGRPARRRPTAPSG